MEGDSMKEKAIEKLKLEMEKEKSSYVQVVGQFLLHQVENNPDAADKILSTDKSIIKSLAAMRKAAEKQKVGNCAVLSDEEGFAVVLKYFGITGKVVSPAVQPSVVIPAVKKVNSDFDVNLEDFLR